MRSARRYAPPTCWRRGLVDAVAPRERLRDLLLRVVALVQPTPPPDVELLAPPLEAEALERGWTAVQRARHHDRPTALHYIRALSSDFVPLRGGGGGEDDPALIGGLARIGDTNVVVIGQERGDRSPQGDHRDGRVSPAGYRKAQRLMRLAGRLRLPLVTLIDTPGAHDGIADEERGLAGAISDCLATMASMTTPTVAVVIGEGGSGGALALTVADRVLMQQNAIYAVTSPEGAAAILFHDRARSPEVAEALGVAAADLLELGAVHSIVPEPPGGAHTDADSAVRLLEPELRRIGRERSNVLRSAAGLLVGAGHAVTHALGAAGSLVRRGDEAATEDEPEPVEQRGG